MWSFLAKWDDTAVRGTGDSVECLAELRAPLLELERTRDTYWLWRLTWDVSSRDRDDGQQRDRATLRFLARGLSDRMLLTFNEPQYSRLLSLVSMLWLRTDDRPDSLFLLGVLQYMLRASYFRSCAGLQNWADWPAECELGALGGAADPERIRRSPQLELFRDGKIPHPCLVGGAPGGENEVESEMVAQFVAAQRAEDLAAGRTAQSPALSFGWSKTLAPSIYENLVLVLARYFKQNKLFRLLPDLFRTSACLTHRYLFVNMTAPFFHSIGNAGSEKAVVRYEYQVARLAQDMRTNALVYEIHASSMSSLFDHFFMSYLGCRTRRAFVNLAHCVWQALWCHLDYTAPHCAKMGFGPLTHASFNADTVVVQAPVQIPAVRGLEDPELIYELDHDTELPHTSRRLDPLLDRSVRPTVQPGRARTGTGTTKASSRRRRIGYLSAFFHEIHSAFRDRQGIIRRCPADEWELVVLCVEEPTQDLNRQLFGVADQIVVLSTGLAEAHLQIAAAELDVLVYCDIGMHPLTYYLSFARLAPVQVNTWGHSDTSGVPSVDYFVSSEFFEPGASQDMYSERLVLMRSLSTFYQPLFDCTHAHRLRCDLGVPADGPLLVCLQSLFKFSAEFLDTLVLIAAQNPHAYIVLLKDTKVAGITGVAEEQRLFEMRLTAALAKAQTTFPTPGLNLRRQIVLLDRLALVPYQSLVMYADLMLDPFPFGGCNSSFEAFQYGKPVVTWPSATRLNGRFTQGLYRRMGIACRGIVGSAAEYAETVKFWLGDENLGRDDYVRTCALIQRRRHLLFAEQESVDEWYALMGSLKPCPPKPIK